MLEVKMLAVKMFTANMLTVRIPDTILTASCNNQGTNIPGKQGPASAKALRFM